jgi:hypothetical protein
MAKDSVVRPERLELPTYWFEAMNDPPFNNLDGVKQSEAEKYYHSVSLRAVASQCLPGIVIALKAWFSSLANTVHASLPSLERDTAEKHDGNRREHHQ